MADKVIRKNNEKRSVTVKLTNDEAAFIRHLLFDYSDTVLLHPRWALRMKIEYAIDLAKRFV